MRGRVRSAALALVAGMATFAGTCNTPTEPDGGDTNVQVVQTVNVGGNPQASPSPGSANGVCLPVATVGVKLHGSVEDRSCTITVGSSCTGDATPKDAAGNTRPDQCNVNDGISWSIAGPCTVQDGSSFTPRFQGNSAGTCYASATVKGVVSNTFQVNVNPRPSLWELLTGW